jgi:hypothetical protein
MKPRLPNNGQGNSTSAPNSCEERYFVISNRRNEPLSLPGIAVLAAA